MKWKDTPVLEYALISAAIVAVGWGIWSRRTMWRLPWERLLTLSLILQGVGFALVAPWEPERRLGRFLLLVTGIAHLRDYFGHLAFFGALCCLIYAVAHRLVPDEEMEHHMRRVELLCGVAAFAMLTALTVSRSTRHITAPDFFDVAPDGWLIAYWAVYGGALVFLVGYLIRMLLILRRDSRSRAPADMYIVAALLGLVGVTSRAIAMAQPELDVPARAVWTPLCASCLVAVGAATASAWRKRRWLMPPAARIEARPEVIVVAPPSSRLG